MIEEEQQDRAVLYVLGSLDQREVSALEVAIRNDPELHAFVRELRETLSAVALSAAPKQPPAALKQRVLREIASDLEKSQTRRIVSRASTWIPWAIAALFLLFCGVLAYDRGQLRRQIAEVRSIDPLMRTKFVALAPANGAPSGAKAMVAWEPEKQSGVIQISGMPAAESGKDYQLWAIDADHKDPVSAGIVNVDPNGVVQVRFKPIVATNRVQAFAITSERHGGVRKAEGPILLVGKG